MKVTLNWAIISEFSVIKYLAFGEGMSALLTLFVFDAVVYNNLYSGCFE